MTATNLLAEADGLISDTQISYEHEYDPEWKRNIGFELQGMKRMRAIIAKNQMADDPSNPGAPKNLRKQTNP